MIRFWCSKQTFKHDYAFDSMLKPSISEFLVQVYNRIEAHFQSNSTLEYPSQMLAKNRGITKFPFGILKILKNKTTRPTLRGNINIRKIRDIPG